MDENRAQPADHLSSAGQGAAGLRPSEPGSGAVSETLSDSALAGALAGLAPITLAEVAGAGLMDRSETKFLIPGGALPALLSDLSAHYRVLTIGEQTVLPYRSLYLDTPGFDLYYAHHNGRPRRFKVRFRSYEQTATTFLEVKERHRDGRTVKSRTPVAAPQLPVDPSLHPAGTALIGQVPTRDQRLEPKLWVNYHRITLVGRGEPERVTLDLRLEFIRPEPGRSEQTAAGQMADGQTADRQTQPMGDVVIVELKRTSLRQPSALAAYLRARGYRSGRFSKYGVGCSLLHPVRHNTFKAQYLAFERLSSVQHGRSA